MSSDFYRAFEDRYRGSRELIKKRLSAYLPFISAVKAAHGDCRALDLGCGRGEWLELLIENGIDAQGVDLDAGMLEGCKALQLPACNKDALTALIELEDNSVSLVSGFHIVEHLPFSVLQSVTAEALRVLKPGGLLIFETPNAENLLVSTYSFYLDPTHEKPIPTLLLGFLVEHTGFAKHKVVRLQEPALVDEASGTRLLDVFRGVSPDYAIVALKDAEPAVIGMFDQAFAPRYGIDFDELAERYEAELRNKLQSNIALNAQLREEVCERVQTNRQDVDRLEQQVQLLTAQLANNQAVLERGEWLAELAISPVNQLTQTLLNLQQSNQQQFQHLLEESRTMARDAMAAQREQSELLLQIQMQQKDRELELLKAQYQEELRALQSSQAETIKSASSERIVFLESQLNETGAWALSLEAQIHQLQASLTARQSHWRARLYRLPGLPRRVASRLRARARNLLVARLHRMAGSYVLRTLAKKLLRYFPGLKRRVVTTLYGKSPVPQVVIADPINTGVSMSASAKKAYRVLRNANKEMVAE